ncbi:unnamed protein product [Acanthosepion pharaonis]|uniref:Uncharacterized protein n=1 Tax=Acanthosepion pharaonis TaxID=158019 RepID=A0A812CVQ5_ACAPH|nr:unnamed protein product [Sepia pharaonis]
MPSCFIHLFNEFLFSFFLAFQCLLLISFLFYFFPYSLLRYFFPFMCFLFYFTIFSFFTSLFVTFFAFRFIFSFFRLFLGSFVLSFYLYISFSSILYFLSFFPIFQNFYFLFFLHLSFSIIDSFSILFLFSLHLSLSLSLSLIPLFILLYFFFSTPYRISPSTIICYHFTLIFLEDKHLLYSLVRLSLFFTASCPKANNSRYLSMLFPPKHSVNSSPFQLFSLCENVTKNKSRHTCF